MRNHPAKYGGANGNKIGILYNNEKYLLKFPARNKKTDKYSSACISEQLGYHIFNLCEIEVQKTILGEYNGKIVVACKDFRTDDDDFYDFTSIKNSIIDSENGGYGTDLNDILATIQKQNIMPPQLRNSLESWQFVKLICQAFLEFIINRGNFIKIRTKCHIYFTNSKKTFLERKNFLD